MQGFLRVVQLLTMVVWVGGLIFFAFVLAPIAFGTLTVHQAGMLVGAVLHPFHIIGLVCGAMFCGATAFMYRNATVRVRGRYEMEFLLAIVMLAATAYLQGNVLPAMEYDRAQAGGSIEAASPTSPAKIHFDKLHIRSERVEGVVLFVGLAVLFLMSREQMPTAEPGKPTAHSE